MYHHVVLAWKWIVPHAARHMVFLFMANVCNEIHSSKCKGCGMLTSRFTTQSMTAEISQQTNCPIQHHQPTNYTSW